MDEMMPEVVVAALDVPGGTAEAGALRVNLLYAMFTQAICDNIRPEAPEGSLTPGITWTEASDLDQSRQSDDPLFYDALRRADDADPDAGTFDTERGLRDVHRRASVQPPDQQPQTPQAPPSTIEGEK